jgi:hypothetical protein
MVLGIFRAFWSLWTDVAKFFLGDVELTGCVFPLQDAA